MPNILIKFKIDTYLKAAAEDSKVLEAKGPNNLHFVKAGIALPVHSYKIENNHIFVALGLDSANRQIGFWGRNSWYVYIESVQLFVDGKVVNLASDKVIPSTASRHISDGGIHLLKSFEGLRLQAYDDGGGVWTIGYGTTSGVYPGMKILELQAQSFLQQDLEKFEKEVTSLGLKLNDNQFSAMVTFTYNVGFNAVRDSTIVRLLKKERYAEAADQFLRWNRVNGEPWEGLTRRRQAERALFLGLDYKAFL